MMMTMAPVTGLRIAHGRGERAEQHRGGERCGKELHAVAGHGGLLFGVWR
jgi:hypothetical protein